MSELKDLETFVWVATLGSFRGAATKLNTTQPAVSQRIAQLEGRYGVRLLDRDSRSVKPTEKGRVLLAHAERVVRQIGELRAAIGDHVSVKGLLRLGVAETIVHTWLPEFVRAVAEEFPELDLEIDVDTSPVLRERLLHREIDLAFMLGPLVAPEVQNGPLSRFPLAFIASPALGLDGPDVSLSRLAAHPVITFARRTQPYALVRELLLQPGMPQPRLHASSALAPVIRLAVEGFGVAVIPTAIVAAELAAGRLMVIDTPVALPDLEFTATWLRTADRRAAELVAAVAARVSEAHAA